MTEEASRSSSRRHIRPSAREDVRKQIAIRKLQDKVTAQLKVQDREIEDFFKQNPQQFVAHPGVAVSDVIADPADNGAKFDAKGDVAAEQKSKDIYARLRNGADFATIARQQSEHESAYRSGDLGFIAQDQFSALTSRPAATWGRALCKCVSRHYRADPGWCRPLAHLQATQRTSRES
jgi:hypothetical protein